MTQNNTDGPVDDEEGKLFVGGLSWETTQEKLQEYFSRYGEVIDCVVMKNKETGRSRGFGFVSFKDPKNVAKVLTTSPHELDGRTIDPKVCSARNLQNQKGGGGGGGKRSGNFPKVFLGGLPPNCTETDIRSFFSRYGNVMEVVLMYDQEKKKARGFGFLSFESEDSVKQVCAEHYVKINGKEVECKHAEPRDKNSRQQSGAPNQWGANMGGPGWGPPPPGGPMGPGGPGGPMPGPMGPMSGNMGYQGGWGGPQQPGPYGPQGYGPGYQNWGGPGYGGPYGGGPAPQYGQGYGGYGPGYGGYSGPPAPGGPPGGQPPPAGDGYTGPGMGGPPPPAVGPGGPPPAGQGPPGMGAYPQENSSYGPARGGYGSGGYSNPSGSYGAAGSYGSQGGYNSAADTNAPPVAGGRTGQAQGVGYHPYRR